MNKAFKLLVMSSALAGTLTLGGSALGFQPPAAKDAKTAKSAVSKASDTAALPSEKDIADAKTKNLVWVNTSSKVYHKSGEFYGKTKRGKFMTETDAQKGGFRAAQEPGASKKSSKADAKK